MTSTPVSSPWAPAEGCRVTLWKPLISASISCRRTMSSNAPWTVSTGCKGWMSTKPRMRAATSLTLGLYFMVQLPRG